MEPTQNIQNSYDWSDKLILVAEDQEINQMFFSKAFKKTNVKILWASDGQIAVTLCKMYDNIDLILMDIRMPKMDGLEATKEIRKINKQIPIIAQTAYPEYSSKNDCLQAGCSDFLTKPIQVQLMLQKINVFFNNSIIK